MYPQQTLIISPQNIDDDVLLLFADSHLRNLHILQNCYTPSHRRIEPCSAKAWRILKRDNPKLMVHLRVESLPCTVSASAAGATTSTTEFSEIVWQPEAPVHSILYKTPQQMVRINMSPGIVSGTYEAYIGCCGARKLTGISRIMIM